jgi:hypothetical protein
MNNLYEIKLTTCYDGCCTLLITMYSNKNIGEIKNFADSFEIDELGKCSFCEVSVLESGKSGILWNAETCHIENDIIESIIKFSAIDYIQANEIINILNKKPC